MCRSQLLGSLGTLLLILTYARAEAASSSQGRSSSSSDDPQVVSCDVVINGGSTAAFAAAYASAKAGSATCLLEPTDWIGGQMTSNGIPAIDFSPEGYPSKFGSAVDTRQANMPPSFWKLLSQLDPPNFVTCWVSPYCYLPRRMLQLLQNLAQEQTPNLRIFYETVPISVQVKARSMSDEFSQNVTIAAVDAVQRTHRPNVSCDGYDVRPSQDMPDWYSPEHSDRFTKTRLRFQSSDPDSPAIFIDASYYGDLLVLADLPYLQGVDAFDGDISGKGNDTLGQSTEMTFHVIMHANRTTEPPNPYHADPSWTFDWHGGSFNLTWDEMWTRRRSFAATNASTCKATASSRDPRRPDSSHRHPSSRITMHPPPVNNVTTGDISMMAWPDYHYAYLFLSRNQSRVTVREGRWSGGLNYDTLDGAERYSFAAYWNFKAGAPEFALNRSQMSNGSFYGTCHGLAKQPYVRDTRRSIGLDGFVLNLTSVAPHGQTGLNFSDRVAIAYHGVDIWGHRMTPYSDLYPDYVKKGYPVAPSFIPFRSMTNAQASNLLLAGLTMAQTFMVNSALRMHPIEWSSGLAAGTAAALMSQAKINSTAELAQDRHMMSELQQRVQTVGPIDWTL